MVEMVTVDNPYPRMMERMREALEPIVGEGNCGTDINPTQTTTRYVRVMQLGQPTTQKDLEGNEVATNASFQVECFASGITATTDVYIIDNASHGCMNGMGFSRTYGPELMRNADSRFSRLVSRYSRIYTGQLLGEVAEGV